MSQLTRSYDARRAQWMAEYEQLMAFWFPTRPPSSPELRDQLYAQMLSPLEAVEKYAVLHNVTQRYKTNKGCSKP